MELRPHQIDCVNALMESISRGVKRMLVKAPCSFGKTIVFCHISKMAKGKGTKTLIIVDSVALVTQTFEKMKNFVEEYMIGIYCASLNQKEDTKLITISTIQSISSTDKTFGLVIVDEAHDGIKRINGFSCKQIVKDAIFIGFTATPYNAKGLAIYGEDKFYKELSYEISADEMVEKGFICPMKYGAEKDETKINLKNVKITGDDFNEGDLQNIYGIEVDKVKSQVDDMLSRIPNGKKVIVMCVGIQHAEYVSSLIPNAITYHSEKTTQERKEILQNFVSGDKNYLVGVMAIYKGLDIPQVEYIVNMRPTRSKSFYVQLAGRGVRTSKGKEFAVFLDYGQTVEHLGFYEDIKETKRAVVKGIAPEFYPKKCPSCLELLRPQVSECSCGYKFLKVLTKNLAENAFDAVKRFDSKYKVEAINVIHNYKPSTNVAKIEIRTDRGYHDVYYPMSYGWAKALFWTHANNIKIGSHLTMNKDGNFWKIKSIDNSGVLL